MRATDSNLVVGRANGGPSGSAAVLFSSTLADTKSLNLPGSCVRVTFPSQLTLKTHSMLPSGTKARSKGLGRLAGLALTMAAGGGGGGGGGGNGRDGCV
jgi:hypothetical protein